MINLFSHPATVHLPLAIAVLSLPTQISIWWLVARKNWPAKTWTLFLALVCVQSVAIALAYFTGERAVMFSVGDSGVLERHWDLAKLFAILWGCIVMVSFAKYFWMKLWLEITLVIFLVAQLAAAVQLGHLGGILLKG